MTAASRTRRRRPRTTTWAATVALLAAVAVGACGGSESSSPAVEEAVATAPADYEYLIPAGTGERIDAGEPIAILPDRLEVQVGELIRIVNEDDRGHLVGPFFVGAGETLSQRFASPGEFVGECSVHPSGQLVLEVRE